MPYLIHKHDDDSVIQFWNLREGPLIVGRGTEANAPVEDPELSRTHFTVTQEAAGFTLQDLGSKNGTLVNGRPVTRQVLKTMDEIRAGESRFLFTDGLNTMAGQLEEDIRRLEKFPASPKT